LQIPLQTEVDIEDAVASLTHAIQQAAWQATHQQELHIHIKCPTLVKQKLAEKRKARKTWQLTSPTTQADIKQASKRTQTPFTHPKKLRDPALSL
jgi:CDP-diacylglycerol pyrophosphatase